MEKATWIRSSTEWMKVTETQGSQSRCPTSGRWNLRLYFAMGCWAAWSLGSTKRLEMAHQVQSQVPRPSEWAPDPVCHLHLFLGAGIPPSGGSASRPPGAGVEACPRSG